MIDKLSGNYAIAHGGYEYDGQLLSALDQQEITKLLEEWRGQVESIAIVGVFSSIKNDQELQVREWIQEVYGEEFPISCSSLIGSVGLIERENATILNAALCKVIETTTQGFVQALQAEGIFDVEVYLCQNDGTLMSIDYAKQFPILTIACGPTNSIRGASYLSQIQNTMVLDVGVPLQISVYYRMVSRENPRSQLKWETFGQTLGCQILFQSDLAGKYCSCERQQNYSRAG